MWASWVKVTHLVTAGRTLGAHFIDVSIGHRTWIMGRADKPLLICEGFNPISSVTE